MESDENVLVMGCACEYCQGQPFAARQVVPVSGRAGLRDHGAGRVSRGRWRGTDEWNDELK
jgi:hypothetical protein